MERFLRTAFSSSSQVTHTNGYLAKRIARRSLIWPHSLFQAEGKQDFDDTTELGWRVLKYLLKTSYTCSVLKTTGVIHIIPISDDIIGFASQSAQKGNRRVWKLTTIDDRFWRGCSSHNRQKSRWSFIKELVGEVFRGSSYIGLHLLTKQKRFQWRDWTTC